MAKIAVIKTGGKQYKVKEGQVLKIEKIDLEVGSPIKFETLMVAEDNGATLELGKPSMGELVEAKITLHDRADKVHVMKYKNKTRYKRNVGHRQPFTKVEITKI